MFDSFLKDFDRFDSFHRKCLKIPEMSKYVKKKCYMPKMSEMSKIVESCQKMSKVDLKYPFSGFYRWGNIFEMQ